MLTACFHQSHSVTGHRYIVLSGEWVCFSSSQANRVTYCTVGYHKHGRRRKCRRCRKGNERGGGRRCREGRRRRKGDEREKGKGRERERGRRSRRNEGGQDAESEHGGMCDLALNVKLQKGPEL